MNMNVRSIWVDSNLGTCQLSYMFCFGIPVCDVGIISHVRLIHVLQNHVLFPDQVPLL